MRFREHIRSNVIGYIALFAFAMSGTASALDGSDTVFSDDIVNGEVKPADIATNAVRTSEIENGQVGTADLGDGTVAETEAGRRQRHRREAAGPGGRRLRPRRRRRQHNKVQDGAVNTPRCSTTTRPVAASGPGPGDQRGRPGGDRDRRRRGDRDPERLDRRRRDRRLRPLNQDVGVLFAEVSATAALDNHSGGVTVTRIGAVGAGQYEVDFGRNIAQCTAVATIGLSGAGAPVAGEVYVADRSGNAEAVFVDTNTSAGAAADRAFRLVVVC